MPDQDAVVTEPKVYRCACGWSGLIQHLKDGKGCQNCGRQLAGDNEAAVEVVMDETPVSQDSKPAVRTSRSVKIDDSLPQG